MVGMYLRQGVGSDASVAAFGYAAFSLGMVVGRSFGDGDGAHRVVRMTELGIDRRRGHGRDAAHRPGRPRRARRDRGGRSRRLERDPPVLQRSRPIPPSGPSLSRGLHDGLHGVPRRPTRHRRGRRHGGAHARAGAHRRQRGHRGDRLPCGAVGRDQPAVVVSQRGLGQRRSRPDVTDPPAATRTDRSARRAPTSPRRVARPPPPPRRHRSPPAGWADATWAPGPSTSRRPRSSRLKLGSEHGDDGHDAEGDERRRR